MTSGSVRRINFVRRVGERIAALGLVEAFPRTGMAITLPCSIVMETSTPDIELEF